MIAIDEHVEAPPAVVYDVVSDAAWYPQWLMGAKRIRAVDDGWPRPGTTFHHTVGAGVLCIRGSTTVIDRHRPDRLELRAGIGPLGAARVRFSICAEGSGSRLTIEEEPERGVVRMLWRTPVRPLLSLGLWGRNTASAKALRDRIESVVRGPAE